MLPPEHSEFGQRFDTLQTKSGVLERFVSAFARGLEPPNFYHSGGLHAGYRYISPDDRHFCLLKAVRAVSAFNASIYLARAGFVQEVWVLLRTLIEFTTHIDFVTSHGESAEDRREIDRYVKSYFADFRRNDASDFKGPKIQQLKVHESIGRRLDETIGRISDLDPDIKSSEKYSSVYRNLSNFVHARYPEAMDMYGGSPGRFHLRGMAVEPKMEEVVEALEAFFVSVSNAMKSIVIRFELRFIISNDTELLAWFSDFAYE
ncbi:MAG: hypothetical protein K2X45_10110 [Phreatobacter sp.]|nr:hypothetical protein [Phreatobacter sp.]